MATECYGDASMALPQSPCSRVLSPVSVSCLSLLASESPPLLCPCLAPAPLSCSRVLVLLPCPCLAPVSSLLAPVSLSCPSLQSPCSCVLVSPQPPCLRVARPCIPVVLPLSLQVSGHMAWHRHHIMWTVCVFVCGTGQHVATQARGMAQHGKALPPPNLAVPESVLGMASLESWHACGVRVRG